MQYIKIILYRYLPYEMSQDFLYIQHFCSMNLVGSSNFLPAGTGSGTHTMTWNNLGSASLLPTIYCPMYSGRKWKKNLPPPNEKCFGVQGIFFSDKNKLICYDIGRQNHVLLRKSNHTMVLILHGISPVAHAWMKIFLIFYLLSQDIKKNLISDCSRSKQMQIK